MSPWISESLGDTPRKTYLRRIYIYICPLGKNSGYLKVTVLAGCLPIEDGEVCQTCPPFLVGGLPQKINICKAGLKMMVKQTYPP